jgi:uncharacterized membrane protein YdbT with pleckstrin-like domain
MNEDKIVAQEDDKFLTKQLYTSMVKEADGFYKQMITISTALLGGSLAFFNYFFTSNKVFHSKWLLLLAWFFLIYQITILSWIRWQNVESHRHALEYLKNKSEDYNYEKASKIAKRGRFFTKTAIISLMITFLLFAIFVYINF